MKNSAFFGCSGEFVAGLCDEPAQMQSSAQIKLSVRAAVFIRSRVKLNANDRGRSAMDIFRVKDGKIA